MNKSLLAATALIALAVNDLFAVPVNYALHLDAGASVECGRIESLDGAPSYTLQLWLRPEVWTPGAVILKGGDAWSLSLANEGEVKFAVADGCITVNDAALKTDKWAQLTIIADGADSKVLVNGVEASTAPIKPMPAVTGELTIGGGFAGTVDELRIWKTALKPDFNYFISNTINRWNPQLDDLAAYYKFDQADCPQIVEQKAVWAKNTDGYNNHGLPSANGVSKVAVTDNPAMAYRVNGAYTANERFYDRAIPADQYLLSNDLIILGIEGSTDGHLRYCTPNNHAAVNGVKYLAEYEGRTGVADFDGTASLDCGSDLWNAGGTSYAFETWMYIDRWVEGANIIARESADKTTGFSITFGDETERHLAITVDGHKYILSGKIQPGKWTHLAVYPMASPSATRYTYLCIVDGKSEILSQKLSDSEIYNVPTFSADDNAVIGENFVGKLDNTVLWASSQFALTDYVSHMNNGAPMPGLGITQTADIIRRGDAYYTYDKADNLGYDSYSQDSWRDIMAAAYEGCDGYEIRISVKSFTGWENTIADASKRKIFAADLARLSEGYDGVELDLEWIYGTQTTLGLLAKDIREALPEGKTFMISCHNVAYQFPKDMMKFVDGFTFQQYGPQNMHSKYSHFLNMCDTFVKYGFEPSKIITSYATTTSKGYINGTATNPIMGVRGGFFTDGYVPGEEVDFKTFGNATYYFNSPLQVYNRARHTVDNDFGGIFYWDMGNDVPVEHQYNMAKWCSYGLNSNVEPHIESVEINRTSGVRNIINEKEKPLTVIRQGDFLEASDPEVSSLSLYASDGREVAHAAAPRLNVSGVPAGIYIAKAAGPGLSMSAKIVIKP